LRVCACHKVGHEKKTTAKPTAGKFSLLRQLCNFIPAHLVPKLARATGVEDHARSFSPWSHVVSLLYAQLTHSLGLNDVCDALRLHSGPLSALRGATPPPKNTLSHANRTRDPKLAEQLFWSVLEHLQTLQPAFGGHRTPRFAFRFKRLIHVVDSTTIQLMARSLDWAKHRRRKAAAKMPCPAQSPILPARCAIVDTAAEHDSVRARELCAHVQAGEIVIFDKAYVDFAHLADLSQRGVFWVPAPRITCNAASSANFRTNVRQYFARRPDRPDRPAAKHYPVELRRVTALVEVDGQLREMVFLTNNLEGAPRPSPTCIAAAGASKPSSRNSNKPSQLADFLGHSASAVKWQSGRPCWPMCLLRFCAWLGQWPHSFTRLFALIRSALWQNWNSAACWKSMDSRWRRTFPGHAATSLSGGLWLILWDSRCADALNS